MVSSKGKLVNNDSMSNDAIKRVGFCCLTYCANSKESLDTNLFFVNSESKGTRNLAILYEGVLIFLKIKINLRVFQKMISNLY